MPTLHGTLAEAEAALRAAGLTLGEITRVESPEPADRVLGQNPAPASALAPGAAVSLTVASGRNTVPQVTGMTIAGATAILESAGFVVSVARPTDPDAPAPTVSTSDPPAGAVLRVGVTIALRLNPAPLPEPTDTKKPDDAP